MRFKEFLLKENEDNYLEVKITAILTSLQSILEDAGIVNKEDINDPKKLVKLNPTNRLSLINIANEIKALLSARNKNIKSLKVLQKVAAAILSGIENGSDQKLVISSCIAELEILLSGSGYTTNKINRKETEGLPNPQDYSIKDDLRNSSKLLKQADQQNPGMETGVDNDIAPPLSGDGQRTLNVL